MLYIKETALKLEDSLQTSCNIKDINQEIKKNVQKLGSRFNLLTF